MGRILEFLKNAAGEGSMNNALGLWRRKVSLAIDEGELGALGFITVQQAADSAALVAATPRVVLFDTLKNSENAAVAPTPIGTNDILYTAATGIWTLTPGLYELEAYVRFGGFAVPASEFATYQWVDGVGSAALFTNMAGLVFPNASTVNTATAEPIAKVIYRVPEGPNLTVKVDATASAGATTVVGANSYAIVRKIARTLS